MREGVGRRSKAISLAVHAQNIEQCEYSTFSVSERSHGDSVASRVCKEVVSYAHGVVKGDRVQQTRRQQPWTHLLGSLANAAS